MAGFEDLKLALSKIINNPTIKTDLAKQARDIIYNRVKSGLGVKDDTAPNPEKTKLKPLSTTSGYIEDRKQTTLGPFGSPARSNLTLSGQMLESMSSEQIPEGMRVFIPETPRNPITIAGKTKKTSKTNRQIAIKVAEEGRPFLAMTEDEQRIIANEINKLLTQEIKRLR